MEVQRRALYNALRMNWLHDPRLAVEPWQVEDYRSDTVDSLFARLRLQDIALDKVNFIALAEYSETPEDLTDELLADFDADVMTQDQVYLLIFELWRRLLPEKICLSIFCDELDHQIFLYDCGKLSSLEQIEDVLANFEVILNENADEGIDPADVFMSISTGCAHDIEAFLYDFISEQIDDNNLSYAAELLDDFSEYIRDVKWFDFLRARLMFATDAAEGNALVRELISDKAESPELEFNFEILASLVEAGEFDVFIKLVTITIPLLETEEDFQDLLDVCIDFYHRSDLEDKERALQLILKKRTRHNRGSPLQPQDPAIAQLISLLA